MIRFVCECGRQLQARDEDVGKSARCPSCDLVMSVPAERPRRERDRRDAFREERDDRDDRPSRRREDDDDYDDRDRRDDLPQQSSGKATASLIFGLLSICPLPGLASIPGLIFGILALRQIGASRGRLSGRGMAITGVVTSCLGFIILAPVALFLGAFLPGFGQVQNAAARAKDQNNLKQIALAFHSFHDKEGRLPQATAFAAKDGRPGLSWRVALLPYMGLDGLYRRFNRDEPWDSPQNRSLLSAIPPVYLMPGQDNDGSGMTYYQVFVGKGTLFEPVPIDPKIGLPHPGSLLFGHRWADVTDGTSNTILVATSRTPVLWTKPDDMLFDPLSPVPPLSDQIQGGSNIAFGDGSVRFLQGRTLDLTLRALITRNGGEIVNVP